MFLMIYSSLAGGFEDFQRPCYKYIQERICNAENALSRYTEMVHLYSPWDLLIAGSSPASPFDRPVSVLPGAQIRRCDHHCPAFCRYFIIPPTAGTCTRILFYSINEYAQLQPLDDSYPRAMPFSIICVAERHI